MLKRFFQIILIGCLVPALAAGQDSASYGPVVTAYLTAVTEELNELDYQLRHGEIRRADYLRAKKRLRLMRLYIERYAKQNNEDLVPEYQILIESEFGSLGLKIKPDIRKLAAGETLEERWKIIGIEPGRPKYYVFQRLWPTDQYSTGGTHSALLAERGIKPIDVIETIVVPENSFKNGTSSPASNSNSTPNGRPRSIIEQKQEDPQTALSSSPERSTLEDPRVLHIFMPQYTELARSSGIEGDLIVRALFQRDGKIKQIKVEKGLGFGLDQKAIDSVRRIGFEPARFLNEPIDATADIIFNFKRNKVTFYLKTIEPASVFQR